MLSFSSNLGSNFTPSSNHLYTGEKLMITSSVTKDVYIRPCISLIRPHMQIHACYAWFIYLYFGVQKRGFFNHNWWLKRFYVSKRKISGLYNFIRIFTKKEVDSNKTLQKHQYTDGFIKEQQFLNRGSNKFYCSHREKKEGTSL